MDMWGNNFDAHFSDRIKDKMRVKDKSFLRKIIPFKEKDYITKDGVVYGRRYFLKFRAIPLFVYTILLIILLPITLINIFIVFIPNDVMLFISILLFAYIILHEVIIGICSQILHL